MIVATLTKNGMINLTVEIRNEFDLKPGDKIKFVDFGPGIMIVPVKELEELVDPNNLELAIQMAKEITEEHKKEAKAGR